MKQKRIKAIVLISLLAINLIQLLMYWLPITAVHMVYSFVTSPLPDILVIIFIDPLYYFYIGAPSAIANVVYAKKSLRSVQNDISSTPETRGGHWTYLIISICILAADCITFFYALNCRIAAV